MDFSTLTPLLIGPLTFAVMQGLKQLTPKLDAQSALVQRLVVMVLSVALTVIGAKLGVPVPDLSGVGLEGLTSELVSGLIAGGLAFASHAGAKRVAA